MTGNITGPLREQSDWEQQDENRLGFIKNKPFYDNRKAESLTIEWDAIGKELSEAAGDRLTIKMSDEVTLVKMSDATPTFEEIQASEMYICDGNSPNTSASIADIYDKEELMPFVRINLGDALMICVAEQETEFAGFVFEKGIYFTYLTALGDPFFPYRLYIPSTTVGELKTIDPKFLPESAMRNVIDLTQYEGEVTDMGTVTVSGAILYLATNGGGNIDIQGEQIAKLKEALNNKKNISVQIAFGESPVELFPSSVEQYKNDNIWSFNLPTNYGGTVTNFLIVLSCACVKNALLINVYVY